MSNLNIKINLKTRKRRSYFQTIDADHPSRASLLRLKSSLRNAVSQLNRFYKQYDLELHLVQLRSINTELEPFELKVLRNTELDGPEANILDAVKIKDVVNSSEEKYLKIRKISKMFLPSLDKIRKMTIRLNDLFTFYENDFGYFNDIPQKLCFIMRHFLKKNTDFFERNVVKLKFCSDGFQCTKTKRLILNFSFSIVHVNANPHSSDGHYILGI